MKTQLSIRPEQEKDIPTIQKINDLAFKQEAEGILVNNLRKSDAFIPDLSLVAELEGQLIGHILFTRIRVIEGEKATPSLALAPMAVLPDFQLKGIGSALIRQGLERAQVLGYDSVIVLGHDKYYPRFGFQPASQWNIRCPFPVPDAAFMALALKKGALENIEGLVEYAAPFSDV